MLRSLVGSEMCIRDRSSIDFFFPICFGSPDRSSCEEHVSQQTMSASCTTPSDLSSLRPCVWKTRGRLLSKESEGRPRPSTRQQDSEHVCVCFRSCSSPLHASSRVKTKGFFCCCYFVKLIVTRVLPCSFVLCLLCLACLALSCLPCTPAHVLRGSPPHVSSLSCLPCLPYLSFRFVVGTRRTRSCCLERR